MNGHTRATGAVLARAHAQALIGAFVETAIGVVTGIKDGIGHRCFPLAQPLAQAPGAEGCGIGLWREAGCSLEQAVQVVRADPQLCPELAEAGWIVRGFEQAAGAGYQFAAANARRLGLAAPAGTIACGLRGGGIGEEFDVLAFGHARFAAGLAINAGGAHGVDEMACCCRVAGVDSLPALFVSGVRSHCGMPQPS
ncbi:hypothetical protein D3C79_747610 [compost metagenome]